MKMAARCMLEGGKQEICVQRKQYKEEMTMKGSQVGLYVDMVIVPSWGECPGGDTLTRRATGEKKKAWWSDDLLYVELHRVEERPHESEADTVQAAALG
jgi:hypothetical protein